jgi:carbohydrate kinase (thermoresistant glucokinase family)
MVFIIMGVSGSGKTTVGKLLSDRLDIPFYDADDFHPESNVEKMRSGFPLTDADRLPWLHILKEQIELWNKQKGAILACSALKKTYREILSPDDQDSVRFIYMAGDYETILNRLKERQNHYMPADLLRSQFSALEEPGPDEAFRVSISDPPEKIADRIVAHIRRLDQG